MKKRNYLFALSFILPLACFAQRQSDQFVDLTVTGGASQGAIAGSYVHNWKFGKSNRWEIGYGIRNTTYKKELAVSHDGITYYFSSLENRQIFQKSPSNYEPQYGGWCAFAMARGEKVSIDPETFKILDNKLYVFYNKFFNNTLKSWNKDEANLKTSADKNWSRIYHN